MAYFLAVDAGGTKAEFLLADEGRELARVTCGTVKRLNATEDQAAAKSARSIISGVWPPMMFSNTRTRPLPSRRSTPRSPTRSGCR